MQLRLIQKQPFGDVLQNRCSSEFHNIDKKTPVLVYLFLIKLRALELRPATLFKKRLQHRYFPGNISKLVSTDFFVESVLWLLLCIRQLDSGNIVGEIRKIAYLPLLNYLFKVRGKKCTKLTIKILDQLQ